MTRAHWRAAAGGGVRERESVSDRVRVQRDLRASGGTHYSYSVVRPILFALGYSRPSAKQHHIILRRHTAPAERNLKSLQQCTTNCQMESALGIDIIPAFGSAVKTSTGVWWRANTSRYGVPK